MAAIFLDLSKAFDSVSHELLLEKLQVYGVKEQSQGLLKSFLNHREQTVEIKINDKKIKSMPQCVQIGVPQGSALGNTLFLIFLNDIANVKIKGEIIQYADDTTVVTTANTTEELLCNISDAIRMLGNWFKINGLQLNEDKTNIMVFNALSAKPPVIQVPLESGKMLNTSISTKLLGFELDPALSWKQHVDATCKKMAKGIYALKQLRPITSQKNLKEIYYAYVHSIMSYGLLMWGNSTDSERVLKMQKRALRVLVGAKYKDSCREHFKTQQILTSASLYILEVLKYVRQHFQDFKIRGSESERSVRHRMCLESVKNRLRMTKKLPQVIGPKLFNKLPLNIRLITCDNSYYNKIKELLLNKTIYNVSEYLANDYC